MYVKGISVSVFFSRSNVCSCCSGVFMSQPTIQAKEIFSELEWKETNNKAQAMIHAIDMAREGID